MDPGRGKLVMGSPPPTRGTLNNDENFVPRPRITPAYAGNTGTIRRLLLYSNGSPPPTRGTPFSSSSSMALSRITPAYAGNTTLKSDEYSDEQDHPRLRGEHQLSKIPYWHCQGSPPPTRGTPYSQTMTS